MKYTVLFLTLLVGVLADSEDKYFRNSTFNGVAFERHVVGKNGNLKFFAGEGLGIFQHEITSGGIIASFRKLLNLQGSEFFQRKRSEVDIAGNRHIVFKQFNKKLEVDGGEIIVHLRPTGEVFAVTSSVLPDTLDAESFVDGLPSLRSAILKDDLLRQYSSDINIDVAPTLCYLILNDEGVLVYRAQISYVDHLDFNITKRSKLYVDAKTGHLVFHSPLFMTALKRQVYSANYKTSLPGTLQRSEGQAVVNDQAVNAAYDNSGVCYNFYKTTFGRDSIDGRGAALSSTVHYSSNYNNAFWDGKQMVYGDGDGKQFSDFAADLSVVCHELTHAVTEYSANLRYQGESGALNEAMSDIFGAASTVFKSGLNENTWLIGHDCYLQGEALRFMNNPILDGASYDWYPTRYKGSADNGGVHWNSGIANLAFVLIVQGGVHPQQKSSVWVEEIGITKAQQIFYSSLTSYMTASTTFAGARAATETAAKTLYGATEEKTIANAWTAVGVN